MALKRFISIKKDYETFKFNDKQSMLDFIRMLYPGAYNQGSVGTWTFLIPGREIVGEGIICADGRWELRFKGKEILGLKGR